MINETLRSIEKPHSFSNRSRADQTLEGLRNESLALGDLEKKKLKEIRQMLSNPELESLIDEGNVTLAVIKPHANDGKNLPENDEDAAAKLIDEIGQDNVIFSFSTRFNEDQVDDFYGGEKEKLSSVTSGRGESAWDSIVKFTPSGPVTFLLIYREEGNAVEWWRERMGKTQPKLADPDSIRGKYAIQENLPNNLTHGSDSIESVKREVGHLRNVVAYIEQKADKSEKKNLKEQELKELGVLSDDENLIQADRFFDSGKRSESWTYGYRALVEDGENNLQIRYLKVKYSISMGGDNSFKAEQQAERIAHLESLGVPVPKTYGARKGALYQEFIIDDKTEEAFTEIRQRDLTDEAKKKMDQLIDIAVKIDSAGYANTGFLTDVLYDGNGKRFVLIDAGEDLGAPSLDTNTQACKNALLKKFGKQEDYISDAYNKVIANSNEK